MIFDLIVAALIQNATHTTTFQPAEVDNVIQANVDGADHCSIQCTEEIN